MDQNTEDRPATGRGSSVFALWAVVVLLIAAMAYLGVRVLDQLADLETQVGLLRQEAADATRLAHHALERAQRAEDSADQAAAERVRAEAETEGARQLADAAIEDAANAREEAEAAKAAAARIRAQAEAEVNRLQEALGLIAETRRTALGVVMNLGGDHLKFEFDKAELRPEDRELLARIAGVLLSSHDYSISVNGHTDDVGSEEYNQKLSERRAQAVRDYLVEAGLSPKILTVVGHGKSRPLVQGTSDAARAKNRRVELGIVNTRILYGVSDKAEE
jgi:outer membrane protein OmpA-like peptidoglycan-associated protein